MDQIDWALNCFNHSLRKGQEPVTREKAKGMYIAKERDYLEKAFGKETVTQIFGEPSHLENAERMIFFAEKSNLKEKLECLKIASYEITYTCFERKGKVSNKYCALCTGIPVLHTNRKQKYLCWKVLYYFFSWRFFFLNQKISAREIRIMQDYLDLKVKDPVKVACLDFIAELIFISLKKIFAEVKNEQLEK